ncbi:surfeit locus protein 6-domain-containing protein [Kockiozyma suomiensis]|uniref:surfeit locus protein 6-domain-containing protein n=1 Tax=Kockiozyma suomiensis TaxID=1337062 RepID=UPI0033430EBA
MAWSAKLLEGSGDDNPAIKANGSAKSKVSVATGISKNARAPSKGDGDSKDIEENVLNNTVLSNGANSEDIDEDEEETASKEITSSELKSTSSTVIEASNSSDPVAEADDSRSKSSHPPRSGPSIAELRERLAQKIKGLRAQRKAPGSGMPGAPLSRDEILKARQSKEAYRKEKEAQKRKRANLQEDESSEEIKTEDESISVYKAAKEDDIVTSGAMFSKVILDTGDEITADGAIQTKKRKKGPSDLLGQLKHVESKKARIAGMDTDKRTTIEEKEKWKRAIKQAEGEKVRDDEVMLKKSLKRQIKQKKKSAKEWQERELNVQKGILARQKKREENIAARREQKAKGGSKKKSKSPAKKKKKRPGFEGGSKKSGGVRK